jgi:hypothetical protein
VGKMWTSTCFQLVSIKICESDYTTQNLCGGKA